MKRYTKEEEQIVIDNYQTIGNVELSKMIGRSPDSVKHVMKRLNLKRTTEQLKVLKRKPNAGHFNKGHEPHNTKFDGYERITKDGYVEVRISKGEFKLKHRVIWEESKGEIPKGYILKFKDKNPKNITLENLYLCSMAENAKANVNREKQGETIKKTWSKYWYLNQLGIKRGWYKNN